MVSLVPTLAAYGSDGLLQLLRAWVSPGADVDRGLAAAGSVLLCDEGGRVADGEAGEEARHEDVSFLREQGAGRARAQAAGLILWTE